jgi:hypothetical protein
MLGAALVMTPAAAVAAPTPVAPPGYQVVNSGPIPVPSSPFDAGGEVSCPAGKVVWGGGVGFTGGIASPGENINTSAPTANGWQGRYNNATSRQNDDFALNAICAKKPHGYTIRFATADNPSMSQSAAVATCPTGTVLLSGGVQSTADTADTFVTSAFPKGPKAYRAVQWNGSARDQRLTAFAICGAKPPQYTIVASPGSSDSGPVVLVGDAQCPAKTSLIGGGIKIVNPMPAITLGASIQDSGAQWLAEIDNAGTGPVQETIYAICAA